MDRKSKILLAIIIFLAVISVGYTFYKTVILGDFEIISESSSAELNNSIIKENIDTAALSMLPLR